MFSIIGAIIIGFFAGLIARALHPGNDKAGFLVTAGLGIAGSLLATFLGQMLNFYRPNEGAGFIASIIGAVIVLAIYNFIRSRTHRS